MGLFGSISKPFRKAAHRVSSSFRKVSHKVSQGAKKVTEPIRKVASAVGKIGGKVGDIANGLLDLVGSIIKSPKFILFLIAGAGLIALYVMTRSPAQLPIPAPPPVQAARAVL